MTLAARLCAWLLPLLLLCAQQGALRHVLAHALTHTVSEAASDARVAARVHAPPADSPDDEAPEVCALCLALDQLDSPLASAPPAAVHVLLRHVAVAAAVPAGRSRRAPAARSRGPPARL